ncbi:MAG: SIS domain-containing protein [Desulfomonile tiedjei]|nr:SIS domain-containing protein [Desulfomonile tiedjei]
MRKAEPLKSEILEIFKESIRLQEHFLKENLDVLDETTHALAGVLGRGNKIMLFGNGGSAAQAQHVAAEFVNRYMIDRPPLPALALSTDTSVITSISNDFSYSDIFEKQIKALGREGDAAVGISTSGKSVNVLKALQASRNLGIITVGIGGPAASPIKDACQYYLGVEGGTTPRVQEVHSIILHAMVEVVDTILFGVGKEH